MNKHILFSGILTAATVLGAQSATPTFVNFPILRILYPMAIVMATQSL